MQRRRMGCCFNGGRPGSALWKSTDAGRTWTKLTGSGLPPGTYGRIALDVSRSNPNVVYVQIEAGAVGAPQTTGANDPGAETEATPAGAAAVPGTPPGTARRVPRRNRPEARAAAAWVPPTTGATTPGLDAAEPAAAISRCSRRR